MVACSGGFSIVVKGGAAPRVLGSSPCPEGGAWAGLLCLADGGGYEGKRRRDFGSPWGVIGGSFYRGKTLACDAQSPQLICT
jgi:hypothetical protein